MIGSTIEKVNLRNLFFAILLATNLISSGMGYGLRFKSHSFPANERTSLSLGEDFFRFTDEISVGFEMDFYDKNCFGIICTLIGDDGTTISLVSSLIEGGYRPGIVINENLNIIQIPFVATVDNPQHLELILKRHDDSVSFIYEKERYVFPVDLSKMRSVKIIFGKTKTMVGVAPVEIQDVRIFTDKQNTHYWELSQHQGDSVYDDLGRTLAVVNSPHWIFDDHVGWTELYKLITDEKIQTAFDPENEIIYLVSEGKIMSYNPIAQSLNTIKVSKDDRVMKYSNYLTFDTLTNQLISYSPELRCSSRFDFKVGKWSIGIDEELEPHYANHGYATDGTYAYLFGGYGFYKFHNNLVRMNLSSGEMEDVTFYPLPDPRTSSSLCVKDGKLYIFGGCGNSIGKQEVSSKNYCDLWEYDLSSMKGRKVWETDSLKWDFVPSSSMYYEERDSCFYFASTFLGGCMMSIRLNQPGIVNIVSDEIQSNMDYRDFVFNLYRTKNGQRYYLVIDKRQDDFSHDYAIYSIAYPFKNVFENNISATKVDQAETTTMWLIGSIITLMLVVAGFIYYKKCQNKQKSISVVTASEFLSSEDKTLLSERSKIDTATDTDCEKVSSCHQQSSLIDDKLVVIDNNHVNKASHFDRAKSSISFLGRYEVKDKNGVDITPKFTSRIKDLLILLVLYSEKDEKGISYKRIDDEIWYDKDEKSAKNNRNVYMRKLRILLEEVGDIEISYDKGYYRIDSRDVFVDYHEAMTLLNSQEVGDDGLSGENLDQLIELLLQGPLLPGIIYEWLDKFKSDYTEISLHLLNKFLQRAISHNDDALSFRIAETMSLHDPLSEEALMVKCRILYKRNMKGLAKNVYDSFCRVYEKSFGEVYSIPFSKIFDLSAE